MQCGFILDSFEQPQIKSSNLEVEIVAEGLSSPTTMAFLDSNSILVLEKEGSVRLVSNGTLEQEPVLNVNVQTDSERGLLGIDVLDMMNIFLRQ